MDPTNSWYFLISTFLGCVMIVVLCVLWAMYRVDLSLKGPLSGLPIIIAILIIFFGSGFRELAGQSTDAQHWINTATAERQLRQAQIKRNEDEMEKRCKEAERLQTLHPSIRVTVTVP